jgi:hypothetical protein
VNVNNGKGIEMLGANSLQLQSAVSRVRSTIKALSTGRNESVALQILATNQSAEGDTIQDGEIDEQQEIRNNEYQATEEISTSTYIVQAFICNELTWFGKRKFDFRMYWMIPSVDPLIVLYTDGFARVGNADYDETDFSDTTKHLTTMTFIDTEMKRYHG